jgi:hypothetical protein
VSRIWVADTCSLLEIRRIAAASGQGVKSSIMKHLLLGIATMIESGQLIFPYETYLELKRNVPKGIDDQIFAFVEKHRSKAERKPDWEAVIALNQNDLVRNVTDPNAEHDEADIYVLALAVMLRDRGNEVGVISEERKDSENRKLSINTACGALGLVCAKMQAVLHVQGIKPWTFDRL